MAKRKQRRAPEPKTRDTSRLKTQYNLEKSPPEPSHKEASTSWVARCRTVLRDHDLQAYGSWNWLIVGGILLVLGFAFAAGFSPTRF